MENKPILAGMAWALTHKAKMEILKLTMLGMRYDLALAVLDEQIQKGVYREEEIYEIPDDDMVK